jgi:hypothetical protein
LCMSTGCSSRWSYVIPDIPACLSAARFGGLRGAAGGG